MKNEEIEKLNFAGWPLPDEYLIEVGRITSLWASLESFLYLCIGKLAGFDNLSDPTTFILFSHSSFPQKLDMLGALCEQLEPFAPNLKGYKHVISKLRTAQKSRNRFTHNGMSLNSESGNIEMGLGSARGTLKTSVNTVKLADIKRVVIEIDEAMSSLYKLVLNVDHGPAWKRCAKKKS